jgi:hypothetical protein
VKDISSGIMSVTEKDSAGAPDSWEGGAVVGLRSGRIV